jgi:acyl-CoA oxidase
MCDIGAMKTRDTRLLPFTPLIYLAWSDGSLTEEEIRALRDRLDADRRLDRGTRDAVRRWLDPANPPDARELHTMLEDIRRHARDVPAGSRRSLAALGRELARVADGEGAAAVAGALEEVERALGLLDGEAARVLLPEPGAEAQLEAGEAPAAFDPSELGRMLEPDHPGLRARVLDVLRRRSFAPIREGSSHVYRARVREWCRELAREGLGSVAYPPAFGGSGDVTAAVAVFETLAYHDLSLLVKFGVHFGLFGGSVLQLGTRRHHERYLRRIGALELPGCFAMTETAHGSNVQGLETTATYDPGSREFVVHTPHERAGKDYIGNAAEDGRLAAVFAQLEVNGERYGVHALLVPIRDEAGQALPGVRIADRGTKGGLNGVDNGRIWFDRVRVPRENLLNRFGDVSEEGVYTSPIASPGRRFFTMLGTLVGGRISIAAASVSCAKLGLTVALRYTSRRRQFGPEGLPEVPVLDYLTMQKRLLPRLASAYALDFAVNELVRAYAESDAREVEGPAAALKAYASELAVDTLLACRQACGGEGYMESSRLTGHLADADVFTTFEGANPVLLQLVAKGLLTEYREHFGELKLRTAVRYLTGRAAQVLADLDPVGPRRTDPDHLRDPDFHAAAFRYREERLLGSLARRLKRRIDDGEDSFTALNACQDHAVQVGNAHAERVILAAMQRATAAAGGSPVAAPLHRLSSLYALSRIESDLGWFMEKGYVEGGKARAIRGEVNALCTELRPDALALVDAFGIPDALLPEIARR